MVLSFSCALIFWGGWPVFILFFACVFWVLKNLADGFCTSSFYQSDVLSIFFFLSFFVVFVFVFGFWIFEGLVCKSKMMRLTWLNLMWNSISLVFKVLWSLYCTVVMCILFGEMNLLLKAFECSFLPNSKVLYAISWAAEFYFYLSKKYSILFWL